MSAADHLARARPPRQAASASAWDRVHHPDEGFNRLPPRSARLQGRPFQSVAVEIVAIMQVAWWIIQFTVSSNEA
jgi:hypothetical protein